MLARTLLCLLIGVTMLPLNGCDDLTGTATKTKAPAKNEIRVADRRRYEIHEIVNGGFHGTVLLDTFTGKCWIFGNDSKNGKITDTAFAALSVYPEPDGGNDPLGIRSAAQ